MHERHGFVTFKANPVTLVGEAVAVGAKAPRFTVLKAELTPFSLHRRGRQCRRHQLRRVARYLGVCRPNPALQPGSRRPRGARIRWS